MANPKLSSLIAKTLATWHSANVKTTSASTTPAPSAFVTIRKWISTIPTPYSSANHETQFREFFQSREWLLNELAQLEERLVTLDSPIVFCHNDLLCANLIYNEEKDAVAFIDYEYGAYNYRGFDIGNRKSDKGYGKVVKILVLILVVMNPTDFCEWAGFDCDYSRYPVKNTQLQWLSSYQPNATQEELESLCVEANAFALLAHFYWTVWALVQASVSDIDFDYLDYAKLRFSEYLRRKDSFLP
jgi:ethanolamine kinase